MNADRTITQTIASFVTKWHWEDVPDRVQMEAKRSLVNCLANALAGAADHTAACYRDVALPFSGPSQAALIGQKQRVDILTASFLNGISANVLDFDDTHFPTVMHGSAPLAPPLFALAEMKHLSGQALLLAFVLGFEIQSRIGNAVATWHYSHGWHSTATCGVFGAAAGAARLLQLDAERAGWALAAAAGSAAGLIENLGQRTKCAQVGNAARNGLAAVLYAQGGASGPARPIEGQFGFARVMGHDADLSAITQDLGSNWELLKNEYKAYPCAIVIAAAIDACIELRQHIKPGDVQQIVLRGKPLVRERTNRPAPQTKGEAAVSAQHTLGVAMLLGRAGLAEYEMSCIEDPAVRSMGAKVSFIDDDSLPLNACSVEIISNKGQAQRLDVINARGSAGRPLTNDELEEKFRQMIQPAQPWCEHRQILDRIWTLEYSNDITELTKLLTP